MRLIIFCILILSFSVVASAQDNVKISAAFVNSDFSAGDTQGIQAELDAKIIKYERFRLGGVFQYVRPSFDRSVDLHVYSAGPQLSYDVFNGRISVFGRALFGVTDHPQGYAFTKTFGAGADINLGHIFIRPIVLDFKRIEGFPLTQNQVGVGGGFRF